MTAKSKGKLQLTVSILLFVVSWWALLWVFSSGSLTITACDSYSLFHEKFRCRVPYIAQILWLGSGLFSLVFLYLGVRNVRQDHVSL